MGLFDNWLWGDEHVEAHPTPDTRYSGTFDDDCAWDGPGVYYVYIAGVDEPVQVGHSRNLRQAIRWTRYELSRDDQFPKLVSSRWEAVPTSTEAEAEAAARKQRAVQQTPSQRIERAA